MDNAQDEQDYAAHFPTHRQSRGACQPHQHRYDPVHDSSGWYQANNSGAASDVPFAPPPIYPHWAPTAVVPHQNWSAYESFQPSSVSPGADTSAFPRPRSYLDAPWADGTPRNYDPGPSFAYNELGFSIYPSTTSLPGNGGSEPAVGGNATQASISSTPNSQLPATNQGPSQREQMQMQMMLQQQVVRSQATRAAQNAASSRFDLSTRTREDTNPPESRHHASLQALMEHRTSEFIGLGVGSLD